MILPDCEKPGSPCLCMREDAVTDARGAHDTVEIDRGLVPVVALARMPYAPRSKMRLRPAWS